MLWPCVCLSICLSHIGILPYQLSVESSKQCHMIAHRLSFSDTKILGEIPVGHQISSLNFQKCLNAIFGHFDILRLHRSTAYIDAACCYCPSSVVSRSVCRSVTLVSPAKTAAPIEMPFGLRTQVSPRNHVLDGGPDLPMGRGNFEGGKGRPIVKYRETLCAKTGGLSGWLIQCRYCRYPAPKGRCHGNQFLAFDGL